MNNWDIFPACNMALYIDINLVIYFCPLVLPFAFDLKM